MARVIPTLETLRRQRFDIMAYGNQPYESWARMVPWQRNDFIRRLNKKGEREKAEADKLKSKLRGKR